MKRHELSEIFGDMPPDDFAALVEDVRENGITDSEIVTLDGAILDGWHRVCACLEAGRDDELARMRQDVTQFDEAVHGSPERFVLRRNRLRRQMTTIQRVIAADRLATRRVGRPVNTSPGAKIYDEEVSLEDAAADMGISPTSVNRWRYVHRHGPEQLVAGVRKGDTSLHAAHETVTALRRAEKNGEAPPPAAPDSETAESPQDASADAQAASQPLADSATPVSSTPPAGDAPAADAPGSGVSQAPVASPPPAAAAPTAPKTTGGSTRAELMAALAECQQQRQALTEQVTSADSERKLMDAQASPDEIEKLKELRALRAEIQSLKAELSTQRTRYEDTISRLKQTAAKPAAKKPAAKAKAKAKPQPARPQPKPRLKTRKAKPASKADPE